MRPDDEVDLEETAGYHAALGHPVRVAVLRALRETPTLPMAELRHRVRDLHHEVDTRNLQHHVSKMQVAGIVDVSRLSGRDVVRLVRDVRVRVRGISLD